MKIVKILKCFAIATLYALAVTSPVWAKAALAHSDTGDGFAPQVIAYTGQHSTAICHNFDVDPTFDSISTEALHIINGTRLTVEQAGEVIGLSVRTRCVQHAPLIARFAAAYMTPHGVVIE